MKVFVAKGCIGCQKALEIVAWLRELAPRLMIEVIDLALAFDLGPDRNLVFAVPTYVYDSRPVFLGNPSRGEIRAWLRSIDRYPEG